MDYADRMLFAQLPPARRNFGAIGVGYSIEAVIIFLLFTMTVAAPTIVVKQYEHIELITDQQQEPEKTVSPTPRVQRPLLEIARPSAPPKLVLPQDAQAPLVPESSVKLPADVAAVVPPKFVPAPQTAFEPLPENKPAAPRVTQLNNFGDNTQATIKNRPPSQVQTGGFGSPTGFAPNPNSLATHPNVATTGSWDLPAGPGYGNGTGGSRGARGVIASSGFGSNTAGSGGSGRGAGGSGRVQTTSFAPIAPVAPQSHVRSVEIPSKQTPVSIQSKPLPVYSDEARALRVEGEVLLEVKFAADGKVTVVRVVRGLGHGLDEAAVRAAQGIRFTPAQRDGRPVDSTATLHILFQLS